MMPSERPTPSPYMVSVLIDRTRTEMRRAANNGWIDDEASGKMHALWWLDQVSNTEWMAFKNERRFLVRRARERQIGV